MSAPDQRAAAEPRSRPWTTFVIAAAAVAAWGWPAGLARLALDRERTLGGEVWRLWTGHLVHFSGSHLAWNLTVLIPAGGWAESIAPGRLRFFFAGAPLLMSAALLAGDPALHVYAGLSGLAAGAITLLALLQIARATGGDRWFWIAVVGLLAAKLALESLWRGPIFATFGSPDVLPVPLVHLAGAACALGAFFLPKRA